MKYTIIIFATLWYLAYCDIHVHDIQQYKKLSTDPRTNFATGLPI